MARTRNPPNPPCAHCGAAETVSRGRESGRPRWRCRTCGRSFGQTLDTTLYRLKTDSAEIIRALRVVLYRGSLRAAEEQTGHKSETIAAWIKRLGDHAEAITDLLARELHLSEVELEERWSFVGRKGGSRRQWSKVIRANPKAPASGGAGGASTAGHPLGPASS
jgi:transposase-like protein